MSEPASTGRHPAAEEIAAFLDGRLEGPGAERLVAHLADCEECRELFAETAIFLRDEERASPPAVAGAVESASPGETPRVLRPAAARWRRPVTIAAVALAAALAAVVVWNPLPGLLGGAAPSPTVAELSASLPPADTLSPTLEATWDGHGWPVMRGSGPASTPEQEAAFRLGVRVVELDVALAAGDRPLADRLTHQVEGLLALLPGADPLRVLYAGDRGIRGRLADGEPPADLLPLNRQGDELLPPSAKGDFPGFVDGTWYGLGKWAGAAQLAAAVGDSGFFTAGANRRFLRQVDLEALPTEMARPVERLRGLVADDPEARRREIDEQLGLLIAVAGGGEAPPPPR